jgi:NADH-quinone oxidoreductase subunit L
VLEYAWLIPILPIISFIVILVHGGRFKDGGGKVAVAFVGASMLLSLLAVAEALRGNSIEIKGIAWAPWSGFEFGILVDSLGALMMFVVSFVGFLIVVYSQGYMHGDPGVRRYYAEISLFIASMLGVVMANNLLLLFIAWELVGLCSYFLIGFWYHKPSAASAAKKAFLVTRVGDFLFLIGILVIYKHFGTLNLPELFEAAPAMAGVSSGVLGMSVLTLSSLLLFGGAVGKSSQFPLHVWLPDAMEGPTTVSALIHAATMVKAGVYLVARTYPLFTPESLIVVAVIGGITALIAAALASVVCDIKRIIAYSTVSSLGLMTLALGVGGYAAGMYYLLNHAFFKALLFLSAGAVLHATNVFDIRHVTGLRAKMPVTAAVAFIGAYSLSGLPPLGGFWGKDDILAATLNAGVVLFAMGLGVSFLTTFFTFRWFFSLFPGRPNEPAEHAHEAPRVMTLPLIILAAGVLVVTLPRFMDFEAWITGWLPTATLAAMPHGEGGHGFVMPIAVSLQLVGLYLAYSIYYRKTLDSGVFIARLRPLHTLVVNRFYLDHIYVTFAERVIAGFSYLLHQFDLYVIDGIVNGIGIASMRIGARLRKVQTGAVQDYANAVLLGITLLLLLFKLGGGLL